MDKAIARAVAAVLAIRYGRKYEVEEVKKVAEGHNHSGVYRPCVYNARGHK